MQIRVLKGRSGTSRVIVPGVAASEESDANPSAGTTKSSNGGEAPLRKAPAGELLDIPKSEDTAGIPKALEALQGARRSARRK